MATRTSAATNSILLSAFCLDVACAVNEDIAGAADLPDAAETVTAAADAAAVAAAVAVVVVSTAAAFFFFGAGAAASAAASFAAAEDAAGTPHVRGSARRGRRDGRFPSRRGHRGGGGRRPLSLMVERGLHAGRDGDAIKKAVGDNRGHSRAIGGCNLHVGREEDAVELGAL